MHSMEILIHLLGCTQGHQAVILMKIDDYPVFALWISLVQKNREIISSKVKSKYWQQTNKYGIRLPNSVKEPNEL